MAPKKHVQQGFALASAIVLLVLLAALGVAMLALGTGQQTGFTQDLMGSRAQAAARSGVDWMMFQLVQVATPSTTDKCTLFGAGKRATIANSPAFSGISVTVRCHKMDGGSGKELYVMNAIACTQPDANGECLGNTGNGQALYVERFTAGGLCLLPPAQPLTAVPPNVPCP